MAKVTLNLPCTPENCAEHYAKRCGTANGYRKGCRCDACRLARNADARQRYAKDPQAVMARNDRWVQKNKEHLKQYKYEWYIERADKVMERVKDWEDQHPDRVRYTKRKAASRRRARQSETQVVEFSQEQLEQRMAYYGNSCYLKLNGCTGDFEHIDHVKPIAKGGMHVLANLRPACQKCNNRKAAKWPFPLAM